MPELFPYQKTDIARLKTMDFAMIGHEPGLGKTAIACNLAIPGALVVCPASLLINWHREFAMWAPDLNVQIIRKPNDHWHSSTHVIVVSYDTLVRCRWRGILTPRQLFVDESHYVKTRDAKRTQEVGYFAAVARQVYLMSGTPMPSRPKELWTQLKMLRAMDLDYESYALRFCDAHHDQYGFNDRGASNTTDLFRILNQVMVRRRKRDVLKDLPPITHQIIEIDAPKTARETELAECIRAKVLDPANVPLEEMSTARKDTGNAKVKAAIEHILTLLGDGRKVLLFAHHKEVIDELMGAFQAFNPVKVTGETSVDDRQLAVDTFQTNPDCEVFIGNIQAAGVGLTLTASSLCVFVELDWTPGVMVQGIDRLDRIGQVKPVFAQYIVVSEGLDHRMLQAYLNKVDTIKQIIDGAA